MSELLDKQVYVLNECFNYKFRDSRQGVTQAHEKCAMKMKVERKKMMGAQNIFDERKEFIRCVRKTCVMDIKRLQVNDSSYIEGTICLE